MIDNNNAITKQLVNLAFIVSIVALPFAIILVILLGAQNYVGFTDNNSIVVASCGDTYFATKYAGIPQSIGTAFLGILIALVCSIGIFVVMLIWALRVNKDQNPQSSVTRITKYALYILVNVAILSEIPSFGYYLTHLIEINRCTTTSYDQIQVKIIFLFSVLLLVSSLCYYLLITYIIFNLSKNDEKYRDVSSQPTEPNHNQIKQKYYLYQPKQQPKGNNNVRNNVQNHQQTKQNLYKSPTRQPKQYYSPQENPNRNHQPSNKRSAQQSQMNKYVPQESFHQISPQKQQKRKQKYGRDDEDFSREQNRYINRNQGRSILPSSGLEQKPMNQRNAGYFGGEPRKRLQLSPQKKISRQGQLISHIRSKYGN